jgi:hypothetical protein
MYLAERIFSSGPSISILRALFLIALKVKWYYSQLLAASYE